MEKRGFSQILLVGLKWFDILQSASSTIPKVSNIVLFSLTHFDVLNWIPLLSSLQVPWIMMMN
jgi:hypothetical protein